MQSTEEIGIRLQKTLPFLRQMLNSLSKECKQYEKISAICDIIDKRKNIKYATLEKCEKVIAMLQNKAKRVVSQEPPTFKVNSTPTSLTTSTSLTVSTTTSTVCTNTLSLPNSSISSATSNNPKEMATNQEKFEKIKSHFEAIDSPPGMESIQSPAFSIQSPDDNDIKSPDGNDQTDVVTSERYESDRPSIYSVVADTIQPTPPPPSSITSPVLNFIPPPPQHPQLVVPVVPTIDTSKPPISADDLKELLLNDVGGEDSSDDGKSIGAVKDSRTDHDQEVKEVHKSKVSLVPTPFHKKVRKNSDSEKTGNKLDAKGHKDVDKVKSDKDSKELKSTKTSKDAKKLSGSKDVSKVAGKTSSKDSKDKAKSKSATRVEKVVESDSIFGSLLSSLDEKFIENGKDGKEKKRRDSKEGDVKDLKQVDQKGSLHSKDKDKVKDKDSKDKDKDSKDKHKERDKQLQRLLSKIKLAEKDMATALKKKELSVEEQDTIKKKYGDRIKRYKKERDALKRHGGDSKSKERRKSDDKDHRVKVKVTKVDKVDASEKDDKSAEIEKPDKVEKKTDTTSKKEIGLNPDSYKIVRKPRIPATQTVLDTVGSPTEISEKTSFIRKKVDDCGDGPKLLPPPLPLGFQDFNPFANETAEINRLNASRKRDPRDGIFGHAGDKTTLRTPLHEVGNDPRGRDPRNRNPGGFGGMDSQQIYHNQQLPNNARALNFNQLSNHPSNSMKPPSLLGRWEPPPPSPRMDWGHSGHPARGMHSHIQQQQHQQQQQVNAEFHPFDPIGPGTADNEYDLSKLPPIDFYSPVKQPQPQNYRQWRQLKQRDEEIKKRFEEEMELKKKEDSDDVDSKNDDNEAIKTENATTIKQDVKTVEEIQEVDEDKGDKHNKDTKEVDGSEKANKKKTKDNSIIEDKEEEKEKVAELDVDETPLLPNKGSSDTKDTTISQNDTVSSGPIPEVSTDDTSNLNKEETDVYKGLNVDEIDRNSLLQILSQAKKSTDGGTYLPARVLELMETFLQKEVSDTSKASHADTEDTKATIDEVKQVKDEEDSVDSQKSEEKNDLIPSTVDNEDGSKLVKVEKPANDGNKDTIPDVSSGIIKTFDDKTTAEIANILRGISTEDPKKNEPNPVVKRAVGRPPKIKTQMTPEKPTKIKEEKKEVKIRKSSDITENKEVLPPRRLRTRTKSVNYNEDSPKRKRKNMTEEGDKKDQEDNVEEDILSTKMDTSESSDILVAPEKDEEGLDNNSQPDQSVDSGRDDEKSDIKDESISEELDTSESDIPTTPKTRSQKRKYESSDEQTTPEDIDQNDIETTLELDLNDTIDSSDSIDSSDTKDSLEPKDSSVTKGSPTNLDKIIEGVANGSILITPKNRKPKTTVKASQEAEEEVFDFLEDTLEEESRRILRKRPKKTGSELDTLDTSDDSNKLEKPEKRPRMSELDILHQDIKENLGEGIMGPSRRGNNNAGSRTSSPVSVKSNTSIRDLLLSDPDLKDVKMPITAGEFIKKGGRTLRVVLEKLPDRCGSPVSSVSSASSSSPRTSRLTRRSKTPLLLTPTEHAEPTPSEQKQSESHQHCKTKKSIDLNKFQEMHKDDFVPDKNYFLKIEKSDNNKCLLCDYNGPKVVQHYLEEHPESEVLISRLPPSETQEAFQESVQKDYAKIEVQNIGGKKFAKFDFRCRFCSHDLQKELTSTFYDHVSSHTGEYRYHCTECEFKHFIKGNVKNHLSFVHGLHGEPAMDDPPKNFDKLFAYFCSECNFLQLKRETISKHIERYHSKDQAYVYTINMSLPILQRRVLRQKTNKKDVSGEGLDEDLIIPERRLRSSQRLQNTTPEQLDKDSKNVVSPVAQVSQGRQVSPKGDKTDKANNGDKDSIKSVIGKLAQETNVVDFLLPKDIIPLDTNKTKHTPPPKSAFVCEDWDELLNKEYDGPSSITEPIKRRSTFLDTLKKRLDQREVDNQPEPLTPTTTTSSLASTAYLSIPIDTEVDSLSDNDCNADDGGDGKAQGQSETVDVNSIQVKTEVPSPVKPEPKVKSHRLITALNKNRNKKIHSVGVIDAIIDGDGLLAYECRMTSCIFQTTDCRVFEVHCKYTHGDPNELLDCNFCPALKQEMTMSDIFMHLYEHVEKYMETQVVAKQVSGASFKSISIKKEKQEEEGEASKSEHVEVKLEKETVDADADADDLDTSHVDDLPPIMNFTIAKVESLAVKRTPPPLAPLTATGSPTKKSTSKTVTRSIQCDLPKVNTKPTTTIAKLPGKPEPTPAVVKTVNSSGVKSKSPISVVFKISPMSAAEIKAERKSPVVIKEWLAKPEPHLFKCPQFNCSFQASGEDAFNSHLNKHDFKDQQIPCLYCNYKMKVEYLSVHLMIRHANCHFGCGYCLYRAKREDYVGVHHVLCHTGMKQSVVKFEFKEMNTRYKLPLLPFIGTMLMPYMCGCKSKFYCTKNYEHHRKLCKAVRSTNILDLYPYNCRYCIMGGNSFLEVFRHIAKEHSSQDCAVVLRQQKITDPLAAKFMEGTNIFSQLVIMDDFPSNRTAASKSLTVKPSTSTTILMSATSTPTPTITPPIPPTTPISKSDIAIVKTVPANPLSLIKPQLVTTTSGTTQSPKKQVSRIVFVHNSKPIGFFDIKTGKSLNTTIPAVPVNATTTTQPSSIPVISNTSPLPSISTVSTISLPTNTKLDTSSPKPVDEATKQPSDLFKCNNCLMIFPNSSKFHTHLEQCIENCKIKGVKPYICAFCKKAYKQSSGLVDHMKVHGSKNLICALCGHTEATVWALKKHVRDVHKLNNIVLHPVDPDKHDINVDKFIGKPVGTATMENVQKSVTKESKDNNGTPGFTSPDISTDKTTFGPDDLHSLPMTPIFKFMAACSKCDFTTKVRSNFMRHMLLHTSGKFDSKLHVGEAVNPVPCLEKNELMFDKMTNLAASSFEGRMAPKAAVASTTSGVATTTEDKAPIEEEMNVPEYIPETKRYVCGATGCNYLCLEEQNLRHHLQALHDNEQIYTCIHCKLDLVGNSDKPGKTSFIDIDAIVNHLRLHESTLFKCPYCVFMNSKASKVERHVMEKHSDKPIRAVSLRRPESDGKTDSLLLVSQKSVQKPLKKRPWKCGICVCRKQTVEEISDHVQKKHTLQAQFKCTYCQFKDDDRSVFDQHFTVEHPSLSPDVIVAYYKDDIEDVEEKQVVEGNEFDTTPLWVMSRDNVKHIRGILLDDSVGTSTVGKVVKNKGIGKSSPIKAAKGVNQQGPGPREGLKRRMSLQPKETPLSKVQKIDGDDNKQFVEDGRSSNKMDSGIHVTVNQEPVTTSGIIEINDNDMTNDDYLDPSADSLLKMPLKYLLKTDFVSTYGPLGKPTDVKFTCPLCHKVEFQIEEEFKEHLYEELQYKQFACHLCNVTTTTFQKMKDHFQAQHLLLCDNDRVRNLGVNASIEMWMRKVLIVQKRIITFNKRKNDKMVNGEKKVEKEVYWHKCGYCNYSSTVRRSTNCHMIAKHPGFEVKIEELRDLQM